MFNFRVAFNEEAKLEYDNQERITLRPHIGLCCTMCFASVNGT